jgi:transposase
VAGSRPLLAPVGESQARGPITKTGSGYARRLLVEAAWHYRRPPRPGATLAARHPGQPEQVLQIAWRAQHRLHRVCTRLRARGKPAHVAVVAVVAVARELACFLRSAALAQRLRTSARAKGAGPEGAGTRDPTLGRLRGDARS